MLITEEDVRRHIHFKLEARDLREDVGGRMLGALDDGAEPDYQVLLRRATFLDPPPILYHTAPVFKRGEILRDGLTVSQPGEGGPWAPQKALCLILQRAQPPGVYVGPSPDVVGIWAHWATWDVWEVTLGTMVWRHDELNPGCWSLVNDVAVDALRLQGTYGLATP